MFDVQQLMRDAGQWLTKEGVRIFLILVLTLIAIKATQLLMDKFFHRLFRNKKDDLEINKRVDTLIAVGKNIINIAIVALGVMMILDQLEVHIGPILTAAGVVGVAIGFGAQQVVRDVINGFFILLDDQIRVGDYIDVAGKSGLVENLNLRIITMRDYSGNVHFVRNGEISVVTNRTKEYSRYLFEIGVAYREDVDEVIEVIKQVDADLRADTEFNRDILEPIEVLGLDKFADSALIIKARTKTKPLRQWPVAREFNRRLKKRFDELGIEIPFPHRTLYMGQDKDGTSPPLKIITASDAKA